MMTARLLRAGAVLVMAAGMLQCDAKQEQAADQPVLETEDSKMLYAAGVMVAGRTVGNMKDTFTEEDVDWIVAGFRDVLLNREPRVAMDEYGPRLNDFLQARQQAKWGSDAAAQKTAGADYLEQAAQEEGAIRTESGLVYTELVLGTGRQPSRSDRVKVHYTGSLTDGTVFDSSVERGEPIVHQVSGFIEGWQEALTMMHVGGKARLVIPPELAYGDRPVGKIPAGSTLVFELELLGIE